MRTVPLLRRAVLAPAVLLLVAACADGPRTVHIGSDTCDLCHMSISQEAFAAQFITDRGRAYVFDSVECLAASLHHGEPVSAAEIRAAWVTDFESPGSWVRADVAHYLRSDELRSPMGMGLSGYASAAAARQNQSEFGGDLLAWDDVLRLVSDAEARGMGHGHAH